LAVGEGAEGPKAHARKLLDNLLTMLGIQLIDLLVLGNIFAFLAVSSEDTEQKEGFPQLWRLRQVHMERFHKQAGFSLVHKSEDKKTLSLAGPFLRVSLLSPTLHPHS
jgi:hypothetical protein